MNLDEITLAELRAYVKDSPLRGVLLEGLVPAGVAAGLRERVAPGLVRFDVADRGRYAVDDGHDEPAVIAGLVELAAAVLEAPLRPVRRRWTRLAHGDYALYKDDRRAWMGLDRHAEMVLDFSPTATGEGQIVWSNGEHVLWMQQVPLCGALVDRRNGVQRYDRYVTHRIGAGEIFRLSLALEIAG